MLFFAALPFVYSESLIDPVLVPRQAFLSVFALVLCVFLCLRNSFKDLILQSSRLSQLLLLINALLTGLSFISMAYAHSFSESVYVASKYGIVFAFFALTYFLLSAGLLSRRDLINGILIFCLISLCYGVYDMVLLGINQGNILTDSLAVTATYGNKNLFASALLLCVWTLVAAKMPQAVKLALIVFVSVFILLLQSKIVVFAGILLFLALLIKNIRSLLKQKTIASISLLFILSLGTLLFLNFSRFVNLASLHTLDTRYALWANSLDMFIEKPLGVGAGNWQVFFPKYGLAHFDIAEIKNATAMARQPHNDFVWMLCELGFQGGLLYLCCFILLFILQIHTVRKTNDPLFFMLLVTGISYCLVAFFDFPLERIEHQVLLSVIMALSMQGYDSTCHDPVRTIKPSGYILPGLALIVISGLVCYYRIKGEYFTRELILLNRKKYPQQIVERCEKARSVFYTIDPATVPVDWYAAMALFGSNKAASELKMKKAHACAPYNIRILNRLGALYARQGKRHLAIPLYMEALRISPTATMAPLK